MFDKLRGKTRGSFSLENFAQTNNKKKKNNNSNNNKNTAERGETYLYAKTLETPTDEDGLTALASSGAGDDEQINKLLLLESETTTNKGVGHKTLLVNQPLDSSAAATAFDIDRTHATTTIDGITDNRFQKETQIQANNNNNNNNNISNNNMKAPMETNDKNTKNTISNGNSNTTPLKDRQHHIDEGRHLLEVIDLKNPSVQNDDSSDIGASNAALKRQNPLKATANIYRLDEDNSAGHDNHSVNAAAIRASPIVFLAAFGALLGALSMGLALGYTAPAFLDMERQGNVNTNATKAPGVNSSSADSILDPDEGKRELQKSLIGSTLAIGALIASLASEPLNKNLGRRIPLVVCGVPFVIGWLLLALAKSVTMLILGRLLIGACCGIACGIAPTYVVEIAPPQIRGALGTGFQLMVVIGNLFASIFGTFLTWQSLARYSLFPAVGMSAIMIFMPESPNWLLTKDRYEDARRALTRLRRGQVEQELNVMAKTIAGQGSSDYSCDIMTSREFCRPLLFALGLMFFQQFTGINAVLMYQSDIFKKASPDSDALMSTIWVCLAQVIATMVCSFLVDRLGRKILLWTSGAGSMVTLVVFGTYSYLAEGNTSFQQTYAMVPLISLILFITFFSFGFGPIPWMMIPELSTSRVRSLVASFGACFAWTGAYIVTASMKPLIGLVGDAWTYWILAIVCAFSCVFIFVLPETKVKSEPTQAEDDR